MCRGAQSPLLIASASCCHLPVAQQQEQPPPHCAMPGRGGISRRSLPTSFQLRFTSPGCSGQDPPRPRLVCAALLIVFYCLQLNYTRPGLPKLNPRLLESWKNEVKEKGHINCPNNVSTVSVFLRDYWSQSPGGEGSFWRRNPPKPGSCAQDKAGSAVQTLVSPPLPGVAAMPG